MPEIFQTTRKTWKNTPPVPLESVRLMICMPPRRLCTLCHHIYAILDLLHPNEPTRCQSCQRCERCSGCLKLKKRKHFLNVNHCQPFKTCQSCRDRHMDRIRNQLDAAHALGLRWCINGSHGVRPAACMSATCDCLVTADCVASNNARPVSHQRDCSLQRLPWQRSIRILAVHSVSPRRSRMRKAPVSYSRVSPVQAVPKGRVQSIVFFF